MGPRKFENLFPEIKKERKGEKKRKKVLRGLTKFKHVCIYRDRKETKGVRKKRSRKKRNKRGKERQERKDK